MPRDVIADFVTKAQRAKSPVPLVSTDIDVTILGGIAIIRTERLFRNTESRSIEATMTFPVPVSAAVTSLQAEIDGRRISGVAKARAQARETYETAIDDGKAAVLHEELLRGVHMVSMGQLGPGKRAKVIATFCMPITAGAGDEVQVRIPTTVGDVYGTSPLAESDDLIHGGPAQSARIKVHTDVGKASLVGARLTAKGTKISLDRPIEIRLRGWEPRPVAGRAADGRLVTVEVDRLPAVDAGLDVAVLFDDSGSMGQCATRGVNGSKFERAANALRRVSQEGFQGRDHVSLWKFSMNASRVGQATGNSIASLFDALRHGGGTTELGGSLRTLLDGDEARDILLITDGKSHALDVHGLARCGRRINVLLVGEDSLEAHVGHLAALTGGQLFATSGGSDIDGLVHRVFQAMRLPTAAPRRKIATRGRGTVVDRVFGGVGLRATWSKEAANGADHTAIEAGKSKRASSRAIASATVEPDTARMIGAFAASLRFTTLAEDKAAKLAETEGLCSHLTSLVLVDEAGEAQEGLPEQRKITLPTPAVAFAASGLVPAGMMMDASPLRGAGARLSASQSASFGAGDARSAWSDRQDSGAAWLRGSSAGGDVFDDRLMRGMPTVGGSPRFDVLRQPPADDSDWRQHFLSQCSAPWPTLLASQIDWNSDPTGLVQGDPSGQTAALASLLRSASRELAAQGQCSEKEALRAIVLVLAERQKGTDRSAARIARGLRRQVSAALHDQVRKLAETVVPQAA